MWRTITSCLIVCLSSAGCNQDRAPQSDLQTSETAQQAIDENTPLNPDRFVGRDGVAEARDAIAAGEPPKLYMHVFNGVAPGWNIPGIDYCQPYSQGVVSFEVIPELAFSEGGAPPSPGPPNARKFATDFNKTMFSAYEEQIKTFCPEAKIGQSM